MENKLYDLPAFLLAATAFSIGMIGSYIINKESQYPIKQESKLIRETTESYKIKFYSINGETAVTEIDGEPILDYLRNK